MFDIESYAQGWNSFYIESWPKECPFTDARSAFFWKAGFAAAKELARSGTHILMPRYVQPAMAIG